LYYFLDTKYTEHNKKTNQFEMKYRKCKSNSIGKFSLKRESKEWQLEFSIFSEKDTLDFPSALAIVVHFLMKREKCSGSNAFSGKSEVRNHDLPDSHRHLLADHDMSQKRKLY